MDKTLFTKNLLKSDATVSAIALTWNNIEGVIPPTEDQPLEASSYRFVVNGIEYLPNDFLDGITKYKCAYRLSGHDTIMLELIKSTGLANIKIRTDDGLDLGDGDSIPFLFYVIMPNPSDEQSKTSIVKFGENVIARVKYENSEFSIEEV